MQSDPIHVDISNADRVVCGAAFAFSALALIDGNVAMVVGTIGFCVATVWLLRMGLDGKRRTGQLRLLVYGAAFVLLTAGPSSCALHTARTNTRMEPVIAALDRYHTQNGSYPKNLAAILSSQETTCYRQSRQVLYRATDGGAVFSLTCMTYGMNHHTYDSAMRRWRDWD